MTEEVGKKVCEGTVADLMKDKTGKQTVVTLTRKNAYRVKKIREQGTDDEAVLFHFRKTLYGNGLLCTHHRNGRRGNRTASK